MSEAQEEAEYTGSEVFRQEAEGPTLGDADATQPPRKRARRNHKDGPATSGARTIAKLRGKGRRTVGMLSELLNMPLDVFFEVAAHLHPIDMLNLGRTSKSLRSLVLAKSSRSAWIASLSTVDGLPSCPANMSEPAPQLCGSANAKWVDYAIRLRLCKACYKANILKGSAILEEDNAEMLYLFPCETGSDYVKAQQLAFPPNRTPRNKYYAEHVITTLNRVLIVNRQDRDAAARLLKEILDDVTTTHIAAVMILLWIREQTVLKELSNRETMSDRKLRITERLQELGYAEDDFPEDQEAWDKLVDQPKPLTDRIWNNIRPKLEELLATEKKRRAQEAFEHRVNQRLDTLIQWYDEYMGDHFTDAERSLMPNHYDARKLPSLLSLAQADDGQGDMSREAFVALTEQMLADAAAYKTRAKRELADLLCARSSCRDLKDLPADDILQRYCAYFECDWACHAAVDGCTYLTYEQLHAHWREAHPDRPWLLHTVQGPVEEHQYTAVDVPELWPHSLPPIGRRALEAVGIALDTPRGVLDGWVREGRLFCACEHPGMPLPQDMSWAKLLFHLLRQVNDHSEREKEMKRLHGKHNQGYEVRPGHSLAAGDDCCIKFLPQGVDTAAASARTMVDDACRAQIEAKLATRPQQRAVAVCRICKGLTRKTRLQVRMQLRYIHLAERPEEIVWHLRCCHGKEFEKRDILFFNL
ncbi:hypothetical protein GSI_03167 [Ganoderma sinense ZZ0214-1]|uniref:F-box domain-containing protein n=1 Tax=Ganoderma sinense ZZ0214-1 TaxID=1077348 RepID=A0A2G8SKV2_9APHY|nr:hypothetical protein GSI_03167 [Ganoderma sinense ZZ0214-1]